jgi:Glycosyl hydrolases family 2, TIM barrel domain
MYLLIRNVKIIRSIFLILFLLFLSIEVIPQKSVVTINQDNEQWNLIVNGRQFYIKGVAGNSYLEKVKDNGGNSIRAGWQKDQLDKAFKLGLNALVNLPAKAERDGMNYNDPSEIRKQSDRIISIVKEIKDHPAVLMWAIGNELDYIPPLKPFNPKVWDAVNDAAIEIHKIDPDHPVMTVIGTSMMEKVADIRKRCPDIDLLGINTYGDICTIQDTLKKYGWTKPYVITEWGPDGYWEVRKTPWGAPYEQTGLEKYTSYKQKYLSAMDPKKNQCLGSYVFYWSGFKQETTHTWFCMFDSTGLESPLVGLMHYLWTGKNAKNEAPVVDSLNIKGFVRYQPIVFNPGTLQYSKVTASDPDGDKLKYRWEIRSEAKYATYAGQGEKVPEPLQNLISEHAETIRFKAPSVSGPYRLFVYVYDDLGHFSTANLPFFVSPGLSDTAQLGRNTSRTLNLLHNSTSQNRNTVKILVYGQSISEQEWWLEVRKSVISRFPEANIIMENKAIGGFAAQLLYKTVEMDVSSFYPDLVLLHDYGDNRYYDSVLYTIRSRTAAEIAIMTDHYTGENKWSDTMSYHILPAFAEKYKCDIINIRDPWKKYLKDNNLEPSTLLKDGVHLNDYGNFLMAELVKPLFTCKSKFPSDQFSLCTTFISKKDFMFRGDTLTLSFSGNKVELITESGGLLPSDSLRVLVDGKPPSAFQGCYFISRPYNDSGKKWPWQLPAMIHIGHTKPWISEEWTCTFTSAETPYSDFGFRIEGSVTGTDGEGKSTTDFISPSGRVIIRSGDAEQGGDWHLNRSFQVCKTIVLPGDIVRWKTYSITMDYFKPMINNDKAIKNCTTLFQGIPNSQHVMQIVKTGKDAPVISEIKIYKPYWNGQK